MNVGDCLSMLQNCFLGSVHFQVAADFGTLLLSPESS
jgi:hypothetical protein